MHGSAVSMHGSALKYVHMHEKAVQCSF